MDAVQEDMQRLVWQEGWARRRWRRMTSERSRKRKKIGCVFSKI